jgi:hypothetical protein
LPLDLAIGDPVDFLSAGAYTASVAAVAFNGFPPIRRQSSTSHDRRPMSCVSPHWNTPHDPGHRETRPRAKRGLMMCWK